MDCEERKREMNKEKKKMERRKGRKLLSAILSFALILTMACPSSALAAGSGGNLQGG